jgi:cysteinyl-tRNA synthetase
MRSDLPASVKKATLLKYDEVLGLRLGEWTPDHEAVPADIQGLVDQRQRAREEKRWSDADSLRQQIIASGYDIDDRPDGPRLKKRKMIVES